MPSHISPNPSGSESLYDISTFHVYEGAEQLTFTTPITPDSSPSPAPAGEETISRDSRPRRARAGQNIIPRPKNAFIFFRSELIQRGGDALPNDHRHVSRAAGAAWKSMTPEEKEKWIEMARQEKLRHQLLYPDYRYSPQKRAPKKTRNTYGHTEEFQRSLSEMGGAYAQALSTNSDVKEAILAVPKVEAEDKPKKRRRATKPASIARPAASTSRKAAAIRRSRSISDESCSSTPTSAWSPATSEEPVFGNPLLPPSEHLQVPSYGLPADANAVAGFYCECSMPPVQYIDEQDSPQPPLDVYVSDGHAIEGMVYHDFGYDQSQYYNEYITGPSPFANSVPYDEYQHIPQGTWAPATY